MFESKGPRASYHCQWGLGFEIRVKAPAADGSERQIRSTRALAFCVLFKKLGSVTNGQNRFRRVVGNFAPELFFERHHQLNGIQAVSAEVVNEARVVEYFFGLNT
jgi:hypothetical protein